MLLRATQLGIRKRIVLKRKSKVEEEIMIFRIIKLGKPVNKGMRKFRNRDISLSKTNLSLEGKLENHPSCCE
jgi:hypothetical protein